MAFKIKRVDPLEATTKAYHEAVSALSKHRSKHNDVYTVEDDLKTKIEELHNKIKDLARKKAVDGQTVRLVNLPDVTVEVRSSQVATTYDLTKAKKFWPADVYKSVMTRAIDEAAVLEALKDGKLSIKKAEKAANPATFRTPAVYVTVKKD